MKHILFPTDFSANAYNALTYAVELARINNSKITLLNTYQMPYNRADMMVSVMGILKQDSEIGLKELVDKLSLNPKNKDIEIETLSLSGDLVSIIEDTMGTKEIDLIVMGTKGASGVLDTIIGSNTSSVIKNVKTPVLAIPEKAIFTDPASIAMAYDLKKVLNPQDIHFLVSLVKKFRAQLQILNVQADPGEDDFIKENALQYLQPFINEINHELYIAKNSDIIDGVNELIKQNKPDMMVMIAKKYRLFESFFHTSMTEKMVFQTDIPLLILHDYKK
jgi:nucleotide-binding universal stress UspA family protein